jgi:hypothetical protein
MELFALFAVVMAVNVVVHRWGVDSRDGSDWNRH